MRSRSNAFSNQRKKPRFSPWCALMMIAASAGESVSAITPEITIEIEIVIANCLYSVPVTPPRNATGMNTATSTSTIEISAPAICVIASFAAASAERPLLAMLASTFSTTTIASSTTRPIARIIPNSVSMFTEKPSRCMPMNVPTIDTGTARIGITVARTDCRNTNTTSTTSTTASKNVWMTFSIEFSVKRLVSSGTR